MSDRLMLPVLPLRETVVFPGVAVPISAGRPGTLLAIEAALGADRRVFAVAQRENRDEVEIDNLHTVGTIVRIAQVQRGPGGMQLLIHGEGRGLALNYLEGEGGALTAGGSPDGGDRSADGGRPGVPGAVPGGARALHGAGEAPRDPGGDAAAVPRWRDGAGAVRGPGLLLHRDGDRAPSRSYWKRCLWRSGSGRCWCWWSGSWR